MDDSPTNTRQKRVKGPKEDAWLRTFDVPDVDRNRLHSLRRGVLNPDLLKLRTLSCYCGNDVHLEDSWHVMGQDGTLVCNGCARCHCCGRESQPISRRLVSIDGMVLCYRCVKFFGYKRYPKLKIAIQRMTKNDWLDASKQADAPSEAPDNKSNSEYYQYNVVREDRCCYTPKEDFRRPVRRERYYCPPAPVRRLQKLDDPTETEPEYLAEDTRQGAMLCPACNSMALGPTSYVVPSMARVYHKRCFRCCNCRLTLAHGVKFPGINFQFCSCEVPLVWCTKSACSKARHVHHKVSKCHLGCLRPGGRLQIDYTDEPTAASLRQKRRPKKKAANKDQGAGVASAASSVTSVAPDTQSREL